MKILTRAPIWDMTLSWGKDFRDQVTLPRFKAAGFDVVSLTVGSDRLAGPQQAKENIETVRRMVEENADTLKIALSADDIHAAMAAGQLAVALNFQGTNLLNGRLELVEEFRRLGVVHMGLVWNSHNLAGASSTIAGSDSGLTAFGRSLLQEMNRTGVIPDGAHASYKTTMDAMAATDQPFIISHTNIYGLVPQYKNVRDDQIQCCAATGGVVGISGFGTYLGDATASTAALFRHIDHIVQLVGPRHAGLGLDFVTDIPKFWGMVRASPTTWPGNNGKPMLESAFFVPEQIDELRSIMVSAGYTEDDISAILGGNWMRVCAKAWEANAALSSATQQARAAAFARDDGHKA